MNGFRMIEIYMIDFFLLQDGVIQIKSLKGNKKGKLNAKVQIKIIFSHIRPKRWDFIK